MTITTSAIPNDKIAGLIADEVNRLRLHERLHNTVDKNKLCNGTIDPAGYWHNTNHRYHSGYNLYTYFIPLTYGALKIQFAFYNKNATFHYISFSYHLPSPGFRWQVLYRDRMERETYDHKIQNSERLFRKAIAGKLVGLVDGIEKWYEDSGLNPAKYNLNPGYGASYYNANFEYLVSAVGRVRLVSRIHADKAKAAGLPSHGDRINELANEMLRLLMEQRDMAPNYTEDNFSETYP